MATMQLSNDGLYFIATFEGLRLQAYQDEGGTWTIGYGATTYEDGKRVQRADSITQARAEQLLNFHAGKSATAVNQHLTATVGQNQFDALVSFTYNLGSENFRTSTLLKVINANPLDLERIEAEFKKWVYVTVNGKKVVSNGLVSRRQQEAYLYGQPSYAIKPNFTFFVVIGLALLYWLRNRK